MGLKVYIFDTKGEAFAEPKPSTIYDLNHESIWMVQTPDYVGNFSSRKDIMDPENWTDS